MSIATEYLEGQGDLVSRLLLPIAHKVTLFVFLYFESPPDPPSKVSTYGKRAPKPRNPPVRSTQALNIKKLYMPPPSMLNL